MRTTSLAGVFCVLRIDGSGQAVLTETSSLTFVAYASLIDAGTADPRTLLPR